MKTPPKEMKPLRDQGEYRSSLQMRINLERTKKVYPHTLYTPKGIGNGTQFSDDFGEV